MRTPREKPGDRWERYMRYALIWMAWFFIVFATFINLSH